MNYLTNYYKNLCEQLEQKLNFLQNQLNEYYVHSGEQNGKKGVWFGPKFEPFSDEDPNEWLARYKPGTGRSEISYLNPPVTPNSEADDLMDTRRQAEQMGGIPSSMVNEPLPAGVSNTPKTGGSRPFDFDELPDTIKSEALKKILSTPNYKPSRTPIFRTNSNEYDYLPKEDNNLMSGMKKSSK